MDADEDSNLDSDVDSYCVDTDSEPDLECALRWLWCESTVAKLAKKSVISGADLGGWLVSCYYYALEQFIHF